MLRTFWLMGIFSTVLLVAACAGRAGSPDVKYPPRRPRCGLHLVYADLPDLPGGWDDIGKLEIVCHIDDSERTCFNKMRTEACRMGGDIVYHLPRKTWRPSEYSIGYRGMVAHSRTTAPGKITAAADEDMPASATAEEAAGPVVPLTGPGAPRIEPATTRDGGAD
jgi:hypothetical protein